MNRQIKKSYYISIIIIVTVFTAFCMSVRSNAQTYDFDMLKKSICESINNLDEYLDVEPYGFKEKIISSAYRQVLDEHPELFYVNGDYNYHYYTSSGKVTKLFFVYCDSVENIPKMKNEFNEAVDRILSKIQPDWNDFEKALYFHEYLTINTAYDYVRAQNKTLPPVAFTAYGALVKGSAVCDGYASAFKLLCARSGIDSIIVRSSTMNHSWNMVRLGEQWYHVDVTWDDPVDLDKMLEMPGYNEHTYFLLSDSEIAKDHSDWPTDIHAPFGFTRYSVYAGSKNQFFFAVGKWFGIENGELRIYDMKNKISSPGPLKNTSSACGADGTIYVSSGNDIYRYLPNENTLVSVYSSDTDIFRIYIDDRSDTLYFTEDTDIYTAKKLFKLGDEFIVNPFGDVPNASWFAEATLFCRSKGYVYGVTSNRFGPDAEMTRAMIVTVLGNIAGIDKNDYAGSSFGDVKENEWYSPYVEWAYRNGITAGYGDSFGINDSITREQMYTMLRGFAEYQGKNTEVKDIGAIGGFDDIGSVSDWAFESMAWAYENKLMSGYGNKIMPLDFTTRAQTVVICYAYVK